MKDGGVAIMQPQLRAAQRGRPAAKERITVITRDNIRTLRPRLQQEVDPITNSIPGDISVGIAPGAGCIPSDVLHPQQQQQQHHFPLGTKGGRKTVGGGGSNIGDPQVVGILPTEGKKKGRPYFVPIQEIDRVKAASVHFSKEDIERRNSDLHAQRINAAETAKLRKTRMEEFDHRRTANSKLSELEQEAKDKSNYLLAKAQMQLEEQEDEIKHLNELMLYAKCVAIRDSQVEEKKLIHKERKEEDSRLDMLMERERVNELKKLEEREKRRVEELRKGAAKIREQIEERREAALLEQERRDQETKAILKTIKDMQDQEKHEKLTKITSQRSLMQEVAKANQDSTERKRQQKIAEEEEDRKVLQYLLDKERREIENDKLAAAKKAEREKELARLRAAQQKISDKQAQQDALRAQRAFEAYEREWRRKEKELAERQAAQEKELREERLKQQRAREHAIAVEAHKMKEEFFENLQRQKETEERLLAEEKDRASRNKKYSLEVQTQIKAKEDIRRKGREEFFMEGVRLAKERTEKSKKIDSIKERKIQELRGLSVPEKYCKEIERKTFKKVHA